MKRREFNKNLLGLATLFGVAPAVVAEKKVVRHGLRHDTFKDIEEQDNLEKPKFGYLPDTHANLFIKVGRHTVSVHCSSISYNVSSSSIEYGSFDEDFKTFLPGPMDIEVFVVGSLSKITHWDSLCSFLHNYSKGKCFIKEYAKGHNYEFEGYVKECNLDSQHNAPPEVRITFQLSGPLEQIL